MWNLISTSLDTICDFNGKFWDERDKHSISFNDLIWHTLMICSLQRNEPAVLKIPVLMMVGVSKRHPGVMSAYANQASLERHVQVRQF